jgi:hypothetical protein
MEHKPSTLPLPANPFLLPKGKKLFLVNRKGGVIGEVILKEQRDVMMGFSQTNEADIMVSYKTINCDPARGIFFIQEEGCGF